MPGARPTLSKSELFTRLAAGHAAGIAVVTPNRRLAQVLRAEFDSFQLGNNKTVWDDADILPLEAFVSRCYEDALYAEGGGELPMLVSEAQARELWQAAIAGSAWADALLDVPQTAARAQEAWKLAQQWGIAGGLEKFPGNEDARAFAEWAKAYARRLAKDGLIDAPSLFALDFRGRIKLPKLLVAYAFDVVPSRAGDVFARCATLHCEPEKKPGKAAKTSFASPKDELEAAARWARGQLESGRRRIGLVVPDLVLRRREVARVFRRVIGSPQPFNLSIGEPLADWPVAAFALALIEFSLREVPFETASRLVRSPFFAGAEGELAARARFDARLRKQADATISLPKLIAAMPEDLGLRFLFKKIFQLKAETQSPHDWAQHFSAVLEAAGTPERSLDSDEYQVRAKLNETLGEFARLSLVTRRMGPHEALARLRRLCADTLFQPEAPGGEMRAPVQVLGLLEAAGIGFDALWVSGLTDDKWPLRAHPDPFLPVQLQRKAGIPESAAETSLALDRRRTEGWLHAADEVVLSWALREEDRDLLPSPLIAEIAAGVPEVPAVASHIDSIFRAGKIETYTDDKAPALRERAVTGGTRLLSDQAACPFRAYAHHRLRAERLDSPEPGLDALDRGNLVHALMAGIWKELRSSAALARSEAELAPVIARAAGAAVRELGLEGRFAELEAARLQRLARDWLDLERARPAFEVVKTEEEAVQPLGPLTIRGRIDRMDRLASGGHVLIDYKTGSRVNAKDWDGGRPDEPQLPFYAVTSKEEITALALAKFRAGDMKFSGFSLREGQLPDVKQAGSWSGLMAGWRKALEGLAAGYAAGEAAVDPKKGLATCRNCDLQPLCRVHERLGALQEDEEGE